MFTPKLGTNTVITVVVNETLYFMGLHRRQRARVIFDTPVEVFLSNDSDVTALSSVLKSATNSLMILPDYWAGAVSYPFQSRKKSLGKSFIERKLMSEYPDAPDIVHFFDFEFSHSGLEKRTVNVTFFQDARAFQLYQRLSALKLAPERMLTPALIWEQKLLKSISEFDIGGTCFIHLLSAECFLYFFFQGRFLFSRRIILSEPQPAAETGEKLSMAAPGKFSVLTFEINQSAYLFAQKTKADMGKIHLCTDDPEDSVRLTAALGRDVSHYLPGSLDTDGASALPAAAEFLGPVAAFNADDLVPKPRQMNLTHARRRQLLEWQPVQRLATVAGALLLLLVSIEGAYLWQTAGVNRELMAQGRNMSGNTQKKIIQQYSQALELLLAEADRPAPRRIIIDVGKSFPKNAWVTDIVIRTEDNPGVIISGIIRAAKVQLLKETLSALLENLNQYFTGSRALSLEDIDFSVDKQYGTQAESTYAFTIQFELP